MMRIGIDLRVLGTGRTSGVEEYTRHIASHLISLDTRIGYRLFYAGRRPLVREPWMHGSNVELHTHVRSNRAMMLGMRAWGRPRLDVLVGGTDVFFFPHFVYGALSRRCARVVTFHDLSYERFPEFLPLRRRLWHRLQMRPRVQANMADRIVAVSHSTGRDLRELYDIPSERIDIIHSGLDPTIVRPLDDALTAFRRSVGLHGRFILSLCTLEPRKNLVGLVRAFEYIADMPDCRDTQLVLAGAEGWMSGTLRRAVHRSRYAHRIRMVGPVPRHDRSLWYSAASVLAYPSFFEGFGFPPLEAMACGTPVISAHHSSLPEVIGDAGILMNPYDSAALGRALIEVLRDEPLQRQMAQKGGRRAQLFTWQKSAERTLETLLKASE